MLEHVRQTMAELTNKPSSEIFIQDLLAVDTAVPVSVTGGWPGSSRWSRPWHRLDGEVGSPADGMIAREIEQKLN
jgi:hypothetical protein